MHSPTENPTFGVQEQAGRENLACLFVYVNFERTCDRAVTEFSREQDRALNFGLMVATTWIAWIPSICRTEDPVRNTSTASITRISLLQFRRPDDFKLMRSHLEKFPAYELVSIKTIGNGVIHH